MAAKWEYQSSRIKYSEMPKVLNDFGSTGWEAFSVVPDNKEECIVFFKRPAKTPPSIRGIQANI